MSKNHGTLYLVALPIGNTDDLSPRARQVLSTVDVVAAEDTRTFVEFCKRSQLSAKKIISHHDHNEKSSATGICELLLQGQSVAIVSDAGTPNVNDPGYDIVRLAYQNNISVVPIPGASSVTTAMSVCPLGGTGFQFLGFAPNDKSGRLQMFQRIQTGIRSVVFETPHRLNDHLSEALQFFGNVEIFIARELTKQYEELLWLHLESAILHFQTHPPRGEFVIIYPEIQTPRLSLPELEAEILECLDKGMSQKDILNIVRDKTELKRQDIYDVITRLKSGR